MRIVQICKFDWNEFPGGIENVTKFIHETQDVHSVIFSNSFKKNETENVTFCRYFNKKFLISFDLLFFLLKNRSSKYIIHYPNPYALLLCIILRINYAVYWHAPLTKVKFLHFNISKIMDSCVSLFSKDLISIWGATKIHLEQASQIFRTNTTTIIPYTVINESDYLSCKKEMTNQIKEICAVGRLVPYKGFRELIITFSKLNYNLTIIGNGPLENEIKSTIHDLNIQNVKLLTKLTNSKLRNELCKMDVGIISSITNQEMFAIVQLEFALLGLPVLCKAIENSGVNFVLNESTGAHYYSRNDEIGPLLDDLSSKLNEISEKSHSNKQLYIKKYCNFNVANQIKHALDEL
jgi:glycosyltransferase involved in cell wall biosynthesis